MPSNDKFLTTLGLARRAGKLFYGYDSVSENRHKLYAVFLSADVSERTLKNIKITFEKTNVMPTELRYTKSELGYALGTKPVGIIGIADKGFADILNSRIKEVTE